MSALIQSIIWQASDEAFGWLLAGVLLLAAPTGLVLWGLAAAFGRLMPSFARPKWLKPPLVFVAPLLVAIGSAAALWVVRSTFPALRAPMASAVLASEMRQLERADCSAMEVLRKYDIQQHHADWTEWNVTGKQYASRVRGFDGLFSLALAKQAIPEPAPPYVKVMTMTGDSNALKIAVAQRVGDRWRVHRTSSPQTFQKTPFTIPAKWHAAPFAAGAESYLSLLDQARLDQLVANECRRSEPLYLDGDAIPFVLSAPSEYQTYDGASTLIEVHDGTVSQHLRSNLSVGIAGAIERIVLPTAD